MPDTQHPSELMHVADTAADVPRRILWTGGWDSSFLLLDAVLTRGHAVAPLYVNSATRRSTGAELDAMERMRAAVARDFGTAAAGRIAPLAVFAQDDIPAAPDIDAAAAEIRRIKPDFGVQYPWLAAFARWQNLDGAEMALHGFPESPSATMTLLTPYLETTPEGIRVAPAHRDGPWGVMFGAFAFPLKGLTKPDMATMARAGGFLDVLELARFCHRSGIGDAPCGVCVPCQDAMGMGMGYRLGWQGRLRYRLKTAPLLAPARRMRRAILDMVEQRGSVSR